MTSLDFKEKIYPRSSSHFLGPLQMTSQVYPPPLLAACSVQYTDEFQHVLILIDKIISIIKIVYC